MTRPWITWAGLAAVALAAAVLSFASLRNLAIACGTPGELAWLLPVCVDAAALAATRVWLTGEGPEKARRFARILALGMIALSVAGNAADHFLAGNDIRPPWWTVVAVASVPPLVLGAVAHLAALAAKGTQDLSTPGFRPEGGTLDAEPVGSRLSPLGEGSGGHDVQQSPTGFLAGTQFETGAATLRPEGGMTAPGDAGASGVEEVPTQAVGTDQPGAEPVALGEDSTPPAETVTEHQEEHQARQEEHQEPFEHLVLRAARLVAEGEAEGRKVGRGTIAAALGINEHQARQVLRQVAEMSPPTLYAVGGEHR
ncbi:DUF2637 domain-containing protein [Amycolatopsis cynarae]|uniref:DUF2637 domain-containing protein n=1 Tax=Amycolatopsis cynarae TaxID=2995223 RepID=A0ABY7AXK1_9PSEU|nr:DUF2637 domain-containing protein [Amycolatopsis sp. HUAS 11-8]WAL64452.1 DUF2637 domain-containing protein [Amycolatopsis sp. HUAS 11-8]